MPPHDPSFSPPPSGSSPPADPPTLRDTARRLAALCARALGADAARVRVAGAGAAGVVAEVGPFREEGALRAPLRREDGAALGEAAVSASGGRPWSDADRALLGELAWVAGHELARAGARAELAEGELLRELAASIHELFWTATLDGGRILYASPAYERIWGRPTDELYRDRRAWIRAIHPDDRARVMAAVEASPLEYALEYRIVRPDGEVRWVCVRSSPVREPDGPPRRVAGVATDITEQKAAEQALRASEALRAEAQRFAGLGHWEWTAGSHEPHWSEESYRIFGRAPGDVVPNFESFLAMVHPDDRDRVREGTERAVRAGGAYRVEHRVVRPDGEVRVVESRVEAWHDAAGAPVRILGTMLDVTERRRAESERERLLAIIDATPDVVGLADPGGGMLFLNRAGRRTLGIAEDEDVRGLPVARFATEESVRVLAGQAAPEAARTGIWRGETVLRARDGTETPVSHVVLAHRDPAGQVECFSTVARDVTEQRETEAALRESQTVARQLAEAVNAVFWMYDFAEGRTIFASPAYERVWGRPVAALYRDRRAWAEAVHPDDRDRVLAAMDADRRDAYELEYRIVRPDGEVRWIHDRGFPVRSEGGEVARTAGLAVDVTDQRRIRTALSESEARYRRLVDASPDAIAVHEDGTVVFINPAGVRLLGATRAEELVGRSIFDMVHPDSWEATRERLRQMRRSGTAVAAQRLKFRTLDGRVVDGEIVSTPFSEDGRLVQVMVRDVSERTALEQAMALSEARFRALVEHASDVISILAADGTIRYESPAVERMLGYAPEELVGRNVMDLLSPDDRERAEEVLQAVLEEAEPRTVELRTCHRDGSERVVLATAVNMLDEPAVAGIVINSHDVTALRQSEERLRVAQRMEALGRLAGGIAHDFNNVLSIIGGTAQLLLLDAPDEGPLREDLAEIERAAERAAGLTRQLLAFSRQQVLQPELLDLNEAVRHTERMLRRTLGEDIAFVTALSPEPAPVRADPGQVEQILLNLAVNARDAMPAGGKLITETRAVVLDDGEEGGGEGQEVRPGAYVMLAVSDTGHGMSREVMERIFEPFFTTKPVGKGTGLGLSTVYGIVRQSGGLVRVYSEPGRGTTFRIYLPRAAEPAAEGGDAPALPDVDPADATVLVVEDEPAVRRVARRALEGAGYTVLEAGDGEEALAVAAAHPGGIDLLFTDVVMPVMSGRELADRIAEASPGVRVLFTSGYTDEAILQHRVLREGAHFIQKPYRPHDLVFQAAAALRER